MRSTAQNFALIGSNSLAGAFDFRRGFGYTPPTSQRFLPVAYAKKFHMNRFAEIPVFFARAARFHGSAKLSLVLILLVLISGVLVGALTG